MEDRYLFKAKFDDSDRWVKGQLVEVNDTYLIIPNHASKILAGWFSTSNIIEVKKDTICQCTGLKDKNGKLIWENDVCDRKEQYPEIVKYCNGDWTLDYSYASHKESGVCYCNLGFYAEERKCVEVIGNKFDNPELLESEE